MNHSSTLYLGLDVHTESLAVAYVAKEHEAEVISLGTIGTRHADPAQLVRQLQAKAKHLVLVYDAGPCGYWLYRYLAKKGHRCWVVAPSLIPQKAGDRSNQHADSREPMCMRRGAAPVWCRPRRREEAETNPRTTAVQAAPVPARPLQQLVRPLLWRRLSRVGP